MCAADYQLELRNNMAQATDTNNTQHNDDIDAMWNDARAIIMDTAEQKKTGKWKGDETRTGWTKTANESYRKEMQRGKE